MGNGYHLSHSKVQVHKTKRMSTSKKLQWCYGDIVYEKNETFQKLGVLSHLRGDKYKNAVYFQSISLRIVVSE